MRPFLKSEYRFLSKPLNLVSRICLLVGALAIGLSFLFPLWNIYLEAPQYQEGLQLDIYAYQLKAGNNGQDLFEINNLNHYIGMKPIKEADFVEMRWMPFALGLFILLALRAAVFGQMGNLVDLFALFSYFGLFSLGAFYYRLYSYGHNLDPNAPMTIEPFTPELFGKNEIANFTQWSYPQMGSYLLIVFVVAILAAAWFSRKEQL